MSAIVVDGVSKRYVIGHQVRHDTLRDTLSHGVKGIWSRLRPGTARASRLEEFWALRDVSFNVEPGEVVGIIGRNGAGKSTLLKILSRITEPTHGRVRLRGRVASLLEVGTGFHPELTGRENIFLNGAILGMSRAEIRQKFDEIVAFAEVERFLDTPVKRYSSGMYVRLAFAVAAHLEPEILIVDEVLAVGDVAFQQKCLGRMRQLSRSSGRTVLYVSHQLASIQLLCSQALLLDQGKIACVGSPDSVVSRFQRDLFALGDKPAKLELFPGLSLAKFVFSPEQVGTHESVTFSLRLEGSTCRKLNELAIFLESPAYGRVALIDLRESLAQWRRTRLGSPFSVNGTVKAMPFVEGSYHAGLFVDCGSGLRQDFPRLSPLLLTPVSGDVPSFPLYPAAHRGFVALEASLVVT